MVRDVALDIGTTKVTVASRRGGVLASGPAVIATETETGELVAFGQAAAAMVGRTPKGLSVSFPIRGGVIVDFEAAESLIRAFLRSAGVRRIHLPRVVACIATDTTAVERRAMVEAVYRSGASDVRLLGHALAGALGSRAELDRPSGSMVVDIGGGTVEAALVSLGGVVVMRSARIGGLDLDAALMKYLKNRRGVVISGEVAEKVKFDLANAEEVLSLRGDTLVRVQPIRARKKSSGQIIELELSSRDVGDAMYDIVEAVVELVLDCIADAPPEIANDLIDSGISLFGGGALMPGLDRLLSMRTKLPVSIAAEPAMAGVRGAQRCLGFYDELADLFLK